MLRETYALLISGNEPRFAEKTLNFQEFLLNELKFNPKRTRVIFCTYLGNEYIMEETKMFLEEMMNQGKRPSFLSLYNGHGGKGTFWPNDASLTYEEWGKLIDCRNDFIFINNSCYSGSSVEAFSQLGLLPRRGLVLASSKADEQSQGNVFLDELMEHWRKNKAYRKRAITEVVAIDGYSIVKIPHGKTPKGLPEVGTVMEDESTYGGYVYGHYSITERMLKRPKVISKRVLQHPVRTGKSLDYLLFKENNIK